MKKLIYITVALLLFTVLFISCKGHMRTFIYEISGTATNIDIRYQDIKEGNYTELINQSLPWIVEFEYVDPWYSGNPYYLSAQKIDSGLETVIATVYVDGILEKTEQTSDSFGFVAVYGTTP